MAQILEATMLVCFGCSWPMNVYKNYKAKTAKSMSLPFTILIITGYIAGIAAKIISGKFNYVLAVYFLNLVMVSLNIVVYVINLRYDRQADIKNGVASVDKPSQMPITDDGMAEQVNVYSHMNEMAAGSGAVFFGTKAFYNFQVNELAQAYQFDFPVYNRSVKHLSIAQASEVAEKCVFGLQPETIFINIGEEDVKNGLMDENRFAELYQWMLYMFHTHCKAKICIVPILLDDPKAQAFNSKLKKLAKETGCEYISAASDEENRADQSKLFHVLQLYMHRHSMSFSDAMDIAAAKNNA